MAPTAEADLARCLCCGYPVIQRAPSAGKDVCPECGRDEGVRAARDGLAAADAAYLRRLRGGAGLLWKGSAAVVAVLALSTILEPLGSSMRRSNADSIVLAWYLLFFCVALVPLAGWWRLASPFPGGSKGAPLRRRRRWIRATCAAGLASTGLMIGSALALELELAYGLMTRAMFRSFMGAVLVGLGLWVAGGFARYFIGLHYLRALAGLLGDADLARRAVRLLWLGPLLALLGVLASGLLELFGDALGHASSVMMAVVTIAWSVAWLRVWVGFTKRVSDRLRAPHRP